MSLWLLTMCSRWWPLLLPVLSVILKIYKYRCLFSCLVILPFSVSNVQKCHIVYIFASQAYNADSRKPVTSWTLDDPNRLRKTGSRYNDILSCVGKPKRSVTTSQTITISIQCLLGNFRQKPHWGSQWLNYSKVGGGTVHFHLSLSLPSLPLPFDPFPPLSSLPLEV